MNVIPRTSSLKLAILPLLVFMLFSVFSFSQDVCDELVCNGDLQISLNIACELELTPDQLLEAPAPGDYTIRLFDEHDNFLREGFLTAEDAGNTVNYQISCGGNSCWGSIIVEANIIPQLFSPCALTEDGSIPADCTLWCSPQGVVPSSLVTPEDAIAAFGNCGPDLLGDLRVEETRTGDICSPDGEVVTISYSGKVILHGQISTVDILTQRYTTIRLDITDGTFSFPDDITLDCDYLSNIQTPEGQSPVNFEFGSPASILAHEGSTASAYPFYIDQHDTVLNIVSSLDTSQVVVGQILRDTMIKEIINGEELWVLKTIVDKVFEDVITVQLDTIGQTNPMVPIVDRVCNVLSGFSDIEFDACGQGQKIIRTWNLIDWCNSDVTITGRQSIEIIDVTAPEVVQLVNGEFVPVTVLSDVNTSIEPWACSAVLALPQLNVIDNCDDDPNVRFLADEGVVNNGFLVDLWLGQSPISVAGIVTDDCGNETTVTFNVIITDDVPPVPICETSIQVSLTGTADEFGIATVYADVFDEGSHDSGCGKVTLSVVRLEDWRNVVRDCRDEIVGFAPETCAPLSSSIDLGSPAGKDDCDANGVNIGQISVAGDFVRFCCDDFGQVVSVILFVEDEEGNVNQCIVEVEVVDASAPILLCEDQVISCVDGDFLSTPVMIGASCERENAFEVELLSENRANNVCAGGQTVREWFIDLDASGGFSSGDPFCTQIISVESSTAFDPNTIKWPRNYDGNSIQGVNIELGADGEIIESPQTINMGEAFSCVPGETDEIPVWCDTQCGLIGFSMESDTILASDACLKIIRSWTLVDWCTFDPNGTGVDDENDSANDSFEAVEDWVQFEDNAPGCPQFSENIGDPVYFRYTSFDRDGFYTYDQIIVVNDDTNPEIDAPSTYVVNTSGGATTKDDPTDCFGSDVISASASDFCGGEMTGSELLQWQITVSSNGVVVASRSVRGSEATMNSQVGSPGDIHIITWNVTDGCGNVSSAQTVVTFGDQQAPTPFCVAGLTTAFMANDGTVTVWGAEFDFGSFDNCTDVDDLRFTIVRTGETPIQPGEAGFDTQTGLTFNCADFTSFEELDVYVWDEVGNGDFCTVGIILADNGNLCGEFGEEEEEEEEMEEEVGSGLMIGGQINTYYDVMLEDVLVTLSSNASSEFPFSTQTDQDGSYAFANNPIGEDYDIQPSKAGDFMAGVSTLDLVLISRHIVELAEFDNPFTILAADVSGDQRISAVDLAELKRLVLGITEDLRNSESWVFVDESQSFFDPTNPWPFAENIELQNLQDNQMSENFVGIRIGDVNQSFGATKTRSSGLLTFNTENETIPEGTQVVVDITAHNFNQISGYQFGLNHSGLNFNSVIAGAIDVDETNIGVKEESLSMLWFSPEMLQVESNTVLFSLVFDATKDVDLSKSLSLNETILSSEAYVGIEDETYAIELVIGSGDISTRLYQNQPNPFSEQTTIDFDLDKAGSVNLSVFNIEGKEVYQQNTFYTEGKHSIQLDKQLAVSSGVLYYRLETGSFSETRKMVKLD